MAPRAYGARVTGDEAARIAARVHDAAGAAGRALVPPITTLAAGAWTGGGAEDLLARM